MFPVIHLVQLAMHARNRSKRKAEADPVKEDRKVALLFIPNPFAPDEQAGTFHPPHIHGGSWRGSETERITNSGQPYPGT